MPFLLCVLFCNMAELLPVFPLPLCLFRDELLPLHIYEPRYVYMVRECVAAQSPFVLLPVIQGTRADVGTIAAVHQVVHRYEGGSCDVLVRGQLVADIDDYLPSANPNKPDQVWCRPRAFDVDEDKELTLRIDDLLQEVLLLIEDKDPQRFKPASRIAEYIHKIGLTQAQEYELLQLEDYAGQQQGVLRWLKELFEHLSAVAQMKRAISLNGHFRDFREQQ
jgi:hypothetical protein